MLVDDDDYEDVSEETAHQINTIQENEGNSLCSRVRNMETAWQVRLSQCSFVGIYWDCGVVSQCHGLLLNFQVVSLLAL